MWIEFAKEKPKEEIIALVANNKGWMFSGNVRATYHPEYDMWVLYDPNYLEAITLDVTHYIPIPMLELKLKY